MQAGRWDTLSQTTALYLPADGGLSWSSLLVLWRTELLHMYPDEVLLDILSVVTKRLVDIDDELLEEATEVLGADTMKEAVNRSLEEVVRAARRRRHAHRLAQMDGLDLADPKVMSGAWR